MNDERPQATSVAQVSHQTWGDWPTVKLSTVAVEVEVASEIGARVISLRDRIRDREWMVQGQPPEELDQMVWAEEKAPFRSRESFGWDECLPTTLVCPDPLDPLASPLRDHGDQWGRGANHVTDLAAGAVIHTWSAPRWPYRFSRRLSFDDEQTLRCDYLLRNLSDEPLPITWAQHALFALESGSVFDLPGVTRVRPSATIGIDLPEELDWPVATLADGRSIDLACVDRDAGWATVVYADPGDVVGMVAADGARLELEWDRDFAPLLRVWLGQGGWPPEGPPNVQHGLEPVTSADDDVVAAIDGDRARTLPPRGELSWWVRLRLA